MALKNPVLYVLLTIFIIVNLVDSITAYFILPAEANPFFLMFNSMHVIVIFKIIIIATIIHFYRRNVYPGHFWYYLIVISLVLGSLTIGVAARGNIMGMQNPELVAAAADIPADVKTQAYVSFITLMYIAPMALSLIAFKLYEWSLKYIKVDKKYYRKLKWWQF